MHAHVISVPGTIYALCCLYARRRRTHVYARNLEIIFSLLWSSFFFPPVFFFFFVAVVRCRPGDLGREIVLGHGLTRSRRVHTSAVRPYRIAPPQTNAAAVRQPRGIKCAARRRRRRRAFFRPRTFAARRRQRVHGHFSRRSGGEPGEMGVGGTREMQAC